MSRDLARAGEAQASLAALTTAELLAICRRAGDFFAHAELPVGDETQTPARYLEQLAATTGMPHALGRRNVEKIRFVLDGVEGVLAGLTRGLDLAVLDAGFGRLGASAVSFRREADALGLVLPSNSPGVHALWLPTVALKVALAIKPGRQTRGPPTDRAGLPRRRRAAGRFRLLPRRPRGSGECCCAAAARCSSATRPPWRRGGAMRGSRSRPGWSKVLFGADGAANWRRHLDVVVASIAENGGRSCVNASGVRTAAHAARSPRRSPSGWRRSRRAPSTTRGGAVAFPSRAGAERLSEAIDRQLAAGGAEDLRPATARATATAASPSSTAAPSCCRR